MIKQVMVKRVVSAGAWGLRLNTDLIGISIDIWLGAKLPATCGCQSIIPNALALQEWLDKIEANFHVKRCLDLGASKILVSMYSSKTLHSAWKCGYNSVQNWYVWNEIGSESVIKEEVCFWGYCGRTKDVGKPCWHCGN